MAKILATEIRAGNLLEWDKRLWRVLKSYHVHVGGRGGAYMQIEIKDIQSGQKRNERLSTDEKIERPSIDSRAMTYSFQDGASYVFMDNETYEQLTLPADFLEGQSGYLLPNMEVQINFHNNKPIGIQLPTSVVLEVVDTEPGIRNATATRINHWITAGCFVLLLLSGLSMFHPMLFWLSGLFGGGQWTRAVHPWIGTVLLVSYAGMIVQFWRDNGWNRDDVAWMRAIDRVLVNDEEGVPEIGRFNAGQKAVFWSMALLVPVLFLTGIVIWEVYFSAYTTIEQRRIAVLIHCLAATAAIIIWIIHVYAAIWVRGSVRSMTRGYVTPGWAWRHHRKWLRRLATTGSAGPRPRS